LLFATQQPHNLSVCSAKLRLAVRTVGVVFALQPRDLSVENTFGFNVVGNHAFLSFESLVQLLDLPQRRAVPSFGLVPQVIGLGDVGAELGNDLFLRLGMRLHQLKGG
jgi:hypothetical protein